jgi:hypothetical protein
MNRTKEMQLLDKVTRKRRNVSIDKPVFNENFIQQVFYLCLLGATNRQIALALGVTDSSIQLWKEKHPEFLQAIKKGQMMADAKVAHSLYQSAVGYSHRETVVLTNRVKEFDSKGKVKREWTEPLLVEVEKKYPPNVMAAIKWLSVRQPSVWNEKLEINGKFTMDHKLDLSEFSTEELLVLSKMGVGKEVINVPNDTKE